MASFDVINTHNTQPKVTKKNPNHPYKFLIIIFLRSRQTNSSLNKNQKLFILILTEITETRYNTYLFISLANPSWNF